MKRHTTPALFRNAAAACLLLGFGSLGCGSDESNAVDPGGSTSGSPPTDTQASGDTTPPPDSDDGSSTNPTNPTEPGTGGDTTGGSDAPAVGDPCTDDAQCAPGGMVCADLLETGSDGICTFTPCPDDGCPGSSTCLELNTANVVSACLPSQNSFCATSCATDLRCALDQECIDAGCCGAKLACPPMCQQSPGACWSNPRCGEDCCDPRPALSR